MFHGLLNQFNLDTSGSFYPVAKIVVNKRKKEQREPPQPPTPSSPTLQLSNSPEFLLPTFSLKAKKTGGNKVDITCSV